MVIAAGWVIPFRPPIHLLILPAKVPDIPVMPIQPIIKVMPSMANSGVIVNNPAKFPVWLVLAVIWIIGAVSVLIYHTQRHFRFMKMVSRWSEPVNDAESLETLDTLKTELKIRSQVKISICHHIKTPMLVGFIHPVILLPPVKFSREELYLILKHELIHLRRNDLWYKVIILLATAIHWFNPVIHLMAKSVAVQCEISCDALVLQGADFEKRKQYGEMIINVVRNGITHRTWLSTNFYGGKKNMKIRISSILDTKQKKAGVFVLCFVLIGIVMTGAALAASVEKAESNIPITIYNTTEEEMEKQGNRAGSFADYKQFGLIYNENTDQLFYNGELVRYFEDYYPVGDNEKNAYGGIDYFNEKGTIDVHGVRDFSQLTRNADGSTDPSGKLIGVEPFSKADFDARNIDELKNPPVQTTTVDVTLAEENSTMAQILTDDSQSSGYTSVTETGAILSPEEYAKMYAVYKPFGLTYDKDHDCFYFNGKLVRFFLDVMATNGEPFSSGKFKGAMRQICNPDGKGEVDVYTVRDFKKLDADGNGTLIGIKAYSQEEFDERTKDFFENDNNIEDKASQN